MLSPGELRLGELLAEGGEGQVFRVSMLSGANAGRQGGGPTGRSWGPGSEPLYKQFRHPVPLEEVEPLVGYGAALAQHDALRWARVSACSSWPVDVVAEDGLALGAVMARAPDRYWLAHRDGQVRLATLSYLAGDPERIEVAYGLAMPAPGSPSRVALVYALARLLDSWQGGSAGQGYPVVSHGDLSAKNVLWSLQPVPSIYVIDCDGAALSGPSLPELSARPRATTANWDDPALPPGSRPGPASDRYVLALAFLRVVGAAHFPLQGRQRASERVDIDLELPRSWRRLPDRHELWELCECALSVENAISRPSPGEWAAQLEILLDDMGASPLAAKVREAQGDPRPAHAHLRPALAASSLMALARATVADVRVRPVLRNRAAPTWQLVNPRAPVGVPAGELGGAGTSGARGATGPMTASQLARRALAMWGGGHRLAARMVSSPGRRARGLRRLAAMVLFDLAAACVGLFLVGMVVSPWIGL